MSESSEPAASLRPTLWSLFSSFAVVSLFGVGGTLAWARRMAVDERKWMSAAEFNDVFALCQFLPGPNVMNFAVVFGARVRGVPGAFVAAVGLCGPALLLMLLLGALYARFGDLPALQRFLGGVVTAAAGLTLGTMGRMALPLFQNKQWVSVTLMLAVVVAVGILKLPLWWALAISLPIGIIIGWRKPR
jgi:Chromate transport protein ChrA